MEVDMRRLTGLIVVLTFPDHVPDLINTGEAVAQAMTENAAIFTNPTLPVAVLSANLAALAAAEKLAQTKAPGAVQARNLKLELVISNLKQERAYVQSLVDASQAQGAVIIKAAAMTTRKASTYQKPPLSAKQSSIAGKVLLYCLASKVAAVYGWQMSVDQKTWTDLPGTREAKTSVAGLTPGSTVFFRVRLVIKGVEQNWSQIISFIVK
jgi:hypothetical protein